MSSQGAEWVHHTWRKTYGTKTTLNLVPPKIRLVLIIKNIIKLGKKIRWDITEQNTAKLIIFIHVYYPSRFVHQTGLHVVLWLTILTWSYEGLSCQKQSQLSNFIELFLGKIYQARSAKLNQYQINFRIFAS